MLNAILLAVLVAPPVMEEIDNPEYKNWAKFKPGASSTLKMVSEAAGNKSEITTVTTLKSLTKDEAVVEMKMTMMIMGNKMEQPPQSRTIPARVTKVEPQADDVKAPKPEEGEEEIEVLGKKLKCKWYKTTTTMGEMTSVAKTWMCDDIPGGLVKMEAESGTISKTSGILAAFTN